MLFIISILDATPTQTAEQLSLRLEKIIEFDRTKNDLADLNTPR